MKQWILFVALVFYYPSFASLSINEWTQEEVGKIVEETASKTFLRLNNAGLWDYPKTLNNKGMILSTDSVQWEAVQSLVLKKGNVASQMALFKKPMYRLSQALQDLENSITILECMLTLNFVTLKCLEALIGSEKLDHLCSQWEAYHKQPFYISNLDYNPLVYLFFNLNPESTLTWQGQGGIAYIANDPNYRKFSSHLSNGGGENLIQVGKDIDNKPLFMGFKIEVSNVDQISFSLKCAFMRDALSSKVDMEWDECAFLKINHDPGLKIRTFSATLINSFLGSNNYHQALQNNLAVIKRYPLPEKLTEEQESLFLEFVTAGI